MMERLTDEQLTAELDGRIALRDSYIKHGYHGTAAAYDATIMALTELKEWRMAAPQLPQPAVVPTFDEWCAATDNKPLGWVKDTMREAYDGCRAAMLQGAEPVQANSVPANSFTNDELECMAYGDNPQANAYRELLAYRTGEKK